MKPIDTPARARPAVALAVSGILAAVAGYVDAVGFARLLGVFPANQSGNVVFLGMAIGGNGPAPVWRTATAIVSFGVGTAAGFMLGRRIGPRHKGPLLVAIEIALLLCLIGIAGPHGETRPAGGIEGFSLIVLASLAMGVQTEAIRHVAGIGVATTYQSGAVARIGEVAAGVTRPRGEARRFAFELQILVLVLVAYIAGAAVGATAVGEWHWAMTVPCGVLAALAAAWILMRRFDIPPDDPSVH